MIAFLDFEASSLSKKSYPIEVAWVLEDGSSQSFLIRPAPDWSDWDMEAEAIHHISRTSLLAEGVPHAEVAQRMVAALSGHDLCASAPSWDGKWLSTLLRAAGLPRGSLRLRDTDLVHEEAARTILAPVVPADQLDDTVAQLVALTEIRAHDAAPMHRALPDAEDEWRRWLSIRDAATALRDGHSS